MTTEIQLLFLVALMVIFWLLMIRPARKAQRTQQELVASLQVGDEVVLNSGIFGRIQSLEDATVALEVAPGTTLKVARQVVVRRLDDEASIEPSPTTDPEAPSESTGPAPDPIERNEGN